MTKTPPDPSRLLPRPRRLVAFDGADVRLDRLVYDGPLTSAAARLLGATAGSNEGTLIRATRDERALQPGGYTVRASGDSIELTSRDDAGLRAGLATLAQIRNDSPNPVGAFAIEDAPSFPTRGVMLDISRDRVPTMASLTELLNEMERVKFNHLQLYTEHTFAYPAHERVWSGASPITPDDVRTLDALAKDRGIELSANQNTLGHMHRWFAHDAYRDLAEITDSDRTWTFETDDGRPIERTGPFSLCATDERSVEFVRGLLDDLLPCFSSDRVNIGLDEAIDLGQGRSAEIVRDRGRGAVFADYLGSIDAIVRAHGKRTLFWSDMLHRDGSALDRVPDGATALVWGYEADAPFDDRLNQLAKRGIDAWVCPGTSCWRSLIGRTSVRRANTENAARAGAANGAEGFLLTEWGDLGHRQHWPIAMHALRRGAQAAWNADEPLTAPANRLGRWIEALGDLDLPARTRIRNAGAIFTELDRPLVSPLTDADERSLETWIGIASTLDDLRASMPETDTLTKRELANTLDLCEVGVRKAIARRESMMTGRPIGLATRASIADLMRNATDDRTALWTERSRVGGLGDSLGYDRRIIDDLRKDGDA